MTARWSIPGLAALGLVAILEAAPGDLPSRPDALLAALRGRYRTAASLSARFTQTYRAPGVETVESGLLYLKRPGLMRWEYRQPEAKLFVADGRNTWLYTPGDRQVMVARFGPSELRATPLELLLGAGGAGAAYRTAAEPEVQPLAPGNLLVRLYPTGAGAEFEFVTIELEPSRSDLERLLIREPTGASSELRFADIRLNPPIDPRQFQFKVPKGVEVIRVDEEGR